MTTLFSDGTTEFVTTFLPINGLGGICEIYMASWHTANVYIESKFDGQTYQFTLAPGQVGVKYIGHYEIR